MSKIKHPLLFKVNIFIFLYLLSAASAFGSTDVSLSAKREGIEKIGIAVTDFPAKDKMYRVEYVTEKIHDILSNDLRLTGLFKLVRNTQFIKEVMLIDKREGKTVFDEWGNIGAQALIKGDYMFDKGKLVIDFRFYDTFDKKLMLNKRYSTRMRGLRKAVHKFCDDIVEKITGDPGVATTKIAFISYHSKHKELYVMDYDGYNVRRLTADRSIILSPSWSPDRRYISYTTYKYNNPDLYLFNIKNGYRKPLSRRKGLNISPDWSFDGKYIAFTLSRDSNSEIYKIKSDGTGLTRLTFNRAIDTSPAWSPDGKKLAFVSDRTGQPQIYIMNSNGTDPKRITFNGKENHSPAWSPKGDKIAYTSRQGKNLDIYVYDTKDKSSERLTFNSGSNENPSWSANGRHIIFQSNRTGKPQLYMMTVNGTDQIKLTSLKGGGYSPSWSSIFD